VALASRRHRRGGNGIVFAKINGPKDVLAGTIFFVAGIVLFFWSHSYEIGSANNMGPGFFPALLGVLLALFGLAAVIKGFRTRIANPLPAIKLEPLLLLLASVVSFGLLIDTAGLVVASFACIFFACFRRLLKNPVEVLALFVVLTVFNVVVFVQIFAMPIRVFWWQ
jgi:hypothetical protein